VSEHGTDAQDFPPIDAEQVRSLLAVVHQGIHTALELNARLAAALPEGEHREAHRLNDELFVALNDVKQRLDEVIGGSR
jgi:hypothetical protein